MRRKSARLSRRTAVDNPRFVGAASRSGAERSWIAPRSRSRSRARGRLGRPVVHTEGQRTLVVLNGMCPTWISYTPRSIYCLTFSPTLMPNAWVRTATGFPWCCTDRLTQTRIAITLCFTGKAGLKGLDPHPLGRDTDLRGDVPMRHDDEGEPRETFVGA